MSMVLIRGTIDYIGPTEQKTEKLSVMKFVLGTDTGPIEIEVANKSIDFFLGSHLIIRAALWEKNIADYLIRLGQYFIHEMPFSNLLTE